MLKKTSFAICLIFFAAINVHAQTQYSYYFDKDLNLVTKPSKAIFLGIGAYQNGLFELKVFDKRDKKLLVIEHFTDSSLALSNGLFVSYLANGNKQLEGIYKMGRKNGLWKEWSLNDLVIDSALFANGNRISETKYSYYPSGKLMSEVFLLGKDSTVKSKMFDENGKEIVTKSKDSSGDMQKIFVKVEVEASFPGGLQAWARYISKVIQSHIDEFKRSDYGTCVIRFIVDKNGGVHDVQATTMKRTKLAEVTVNAISNGPKWLPAQQNGHAVNAYRIQPITLQNPNE